MIALVIFGLVSALVVLWSRAGDEIRRADLEMAVAEERDSSGEASHRRSCSRRLPSYKPRKSLSGRPTSTAIRTRVRNRPISGHPSRPGDTMTPIDDERALRIIERELSMAYATLAAMREAGLTEYRKIQLDFFIFAPTKQAAKALAQSLETKDCLSFSTERDPGFFGRNYVVSGNTYPTVVTAEILCAMAINAQPLEKVKVALNGTSTQQTHHHFPA